MRIWLTVAEAFRYSAASEERVGALHDGGSNMKRRGWPHIGRQQRGDGDGC
jgi:hypothetical protein